MKPCTSFDKLPMDSGENQVFGAPGEDYAHFNPQIGQVIRELKEAFPKEASLYENAYDVSADQALAQRVRLINPMRYISENMQNHPARHYRIRVGASDADTSFSVSMILAIRLQNAGFDADYALVWDQPHSEADYPGEALRWMDEVTKT